MLFCLHRKETNWSAHGVFCREPQGSAQQQFLTEASPKLDDSAWDAYWGWDCAGPKGLCERIYQHLKIPTGDWSGLKHLPTASSKDFANASQADLIKQNRVKLDKVLEKLPEPEVVTASEVAAAAEQVAETQPTADQFASQAGVDDEKDEDLVRDLNRVRSQKQSPSDKAEQAAASRHLHHCITAIATMATCLMLIIVNIVSAVMWHMATVASQSMPFLTACVEHELSARATLLLKFQSKPMHITKNLHTLPSLSF